MNHWGWYWKIKRQHTPRTLCSALTSLDSFAIFKSTYAVGFDITTRQLKARLTGNYLTVINGKRKQLAYQIPFERLPCNYGGFRYFFKCPLCHQRMRLLYFTHNVFLCRKCLNLAYPSQQLRPSMRYQYLSDKMKTLVKNKGGDIEFGKKPPHMRNTTFQKFMDKKFDYEDKAHQALNDELRAWYGARVKPYLDGALD